MDGQALGGRAPIASTLRARYVAERKGAHVVRVSTRARAFSSGGAELWLELLVNGQRAVFGEPILWQGGTQDIELEYELMLNPGQTVDLLAMSGCAQALPCGIELELEPAGWMAPLLPARRRVGDFLPA
ncbi:hypothetical protein [Inhella gelatinilytica]|uniref:Uncharacterized protein n=1 Tax=Inhella gelatinilytica TaxID=2795030 RepID=A0A931IVE6_9BURK|nr:hypothetical protein [Inhella gelatinilytica]MBH9552266.1 hypothetical protein [Inhella gelatinilytica]